MAARSERPDNVNEYEQKRLDRIAANQAKLGCIGVLQQKSLLEASFRSVKRPATPKPAKGTTPATRHSQRLQKAVAEYAGLQEFPDEGRAMASRLGAAGENASWVCNTEKRCRQKGRGSLYDNVAGITCHFCRQKKLCGEEECRHCSERDVEQDCIGKSECSRCKSACGRFCRACLLVRYGQHLEAVREQMAAGTWLCPHCYEEDHPEEDWICNSSICMTKRGLKPTGLAIFEAQQQGFASVAHHLQAQLASRRGRKAASSAKPTSGGAPSNVAKAVCKQTEQVADIACGSSRDDKEAPDAAADAQTHGLASRSAECGFGAAPANAEVSCKQDQEELSQKSWGGDGTTAEEVVVQCKCDSSQAVDADVQSIKAGPSGSGRMSDRRRDVGSSIAVGTALQNRLGTVHANVLLACSGSDKGKQFPGRGSCADDHGRDTMALKKSRQRGLEHSTTANTDVGTKIKTRTAAKNSILGYAVPLRRSGRHT